MDALAGLCGVLDGVPEWLYERTREVASYFFFFKQKTAYEIVTAPDQAGLITFSSGGEAAGAAARLFEAGVIVRDVPGTKWLRASCGWWTSEDDIERLLGGL